MNRVAVEFYGDTQNFGPDRLEPFPDPKTQKTKKKENCVSDPGMKSIMF